MYRYIFNIVLIVGLFFSLAVFVSGMGNWRLPDNNQGYAPKQPIGYSHRLHAGELQIDCRFCHTGATQSQHAGIPSTDVCMKCHRHVTASFNTMSEFRRLEDEIKKAESNQAGGAEGTDETEESAGEPAVDLDELKKQLAVMEIPSPELKKLYDSLKLKDSKDPIVESASSSIPWVRVHNLPDYVYFDHRAHVNAGVSCQKCHGPVESMERVRQFETLSMGWCVNCHRDATKNGINGQHVHASTDCSACHY